MEIKCLFILFSVAACLQKNDPASNQIVDFKQKTKGPIGVLQVGSGAPVDKKAATSSLNTNPITNEYLMETLIRVAQERIPERRVHGKGAGAFGYFKSTRDISHICKAKMFSKVGKKTPIAVRFSGTATEKGGIDTNRETRGFAVKFYTEEGNFDIVAFNTEIFFFKDPLLFLSSAKSSRRNPATHTRDQNMFWDFITLHPESLFTFLIVFSDRGIPDGYRHMPGHSIHTYEVYNNNGTKSWVRFHFHPYGGIKNLNSTEALKIAAEDVDYYIRDLYNAIANGNFPKWKVNLQILSQKDVADAKKAGLDVFDVTKVLPEKQYPMHHVGDLVLNRNPTNYHADVELLAFCPTHMVTGILGAPDKLFEARRLFYKDAHNYRIGVNHNNIPVNCPFNSPALTYNRDGRPPVNDNGLDMPNYYPNSFNGPEPYVDKNRPTLSEIFESKADNFKQIGEWYSQQITSEERGRLAKNTATSLCPAAEFLKQRAFKYFDMIHPDLRPSIAKELKTMGC